MSQPHPALAVDHVTIAGPDLATLETLLAATGLRFAYGGPHSNGVTHMSLATFEDGSYVELISTIGGAGRDAPIWSRHIAGAAGPCAWAVGAPASGVAAEAARLAALGVPVRGPTAMHRKRPDGQVAEWELAYVGEGEPGATLPFVIEDRTPRELRVPPATADRSTGRLTGVGAVILGVRDLHSSIESFKKVYGLPDPVVGGDFARFAGAPVVLASGSEGWLADRLERFGPAPCGFLFATDDLGAAARRLDLTPPDRWLDLSVAWFDEDRVGGMRLGLVEG